jgi:hypothetical protein
VEVDIMARRFSWLAIAVVLLFGAAPLRASSLSPVAGRANGIELCEQAVCGSAIFVAIFTGQVGFNPHALGTIAVSVTHDPLPGVDDPPVNLTGGVWQLQVLFGGRATGIITGGTLENNGDNTFHVVAHMLSAATGALTFDGTLSHNAFPPTLIGSIQ